MAAERPGEFELIARYLAPLATDPGSLALTDDAAVLPSWPGHDLVLTKDMLAADVHFFAEDPAAAIAAKALRVNLSDLAAKGATPKGYLLGLGLPADWTEGWMNEFALGLKADQETYACALYGGDTIRSPGKLLVSITAIGIVPEGRAVRRSGAMPGDQLFLTGTVGDASLGLKLRQNPAMAAELGLADADVSHLQNRYLLPRPRVKAAEAVRTYANAAIDLSDGLVADLSHLCEASGVDAMVNIETLPISKAVWNALVKDPSVLSGCITGGDDYEILAAVPAEQAPSYQAALKKAGVPVTRIGALAEGEGKARFLSKGEELDLSAAGGFAHF
ncbi:thiamine-phosphate kinase [Stappia sp. F7233]|uniref:Thiamine-monophosphate kinase n=1 Tax=Stappia albiluteola TaxID=2758565 RepID=A0A839ACX6_9HYPH|nr:thiamine-phosphate kinase [Stappia albiluteola]MBA5776868.1 thiamine-phosphate kinase [Stappia albiluteola]